MPSDADDVSLPSSDDETNALEDCDTCNAFELDQLFAHKYKIHDEMALTFKDDYILSLCKDDSLTRVVAGLSGTSVNLFDISPERGLASISQLPPLLKVDSKKKVKICGVRFLDETPNLLLVGTTNGLVRLFDLRTLKEQARFENDLKDNSAAYICSFDRNANGRLLCTGSEQIKSEVFLNFYDIRERRRMGSYFDSHNDDVTAIKFHPRNPDALASGSTDGLINVFDLKEPKEDDALLTTINTESSVYKLQWHKNVYNKDVISCITHTNDFKLYEPQEGDSIVEFERDHITTAIKRSAPANCNLVDAHNTSDDDILLLTGSNINKGKILRSLRLQNKDVQPFADYDGNKQIVRESIFDSNTNLFITAGESCIVTLWSPCEDTTALSSDSNKLKVKKSKINKPKPY